MATSSFYLPPELAAPGASAFPAFIKRDGTATGTGLAYDATTAETAFWKFNLPGYTTGNITCDVLWYSDTSTTSTHGVVWQVAIAAITPSVDTSNVETKAFATAQQGTSDIGSANAKILIKTTVAISNLDSVAAGDEVYMKITRLVSDGSDDMTGDAIMTSVRITYTSA